MGRWVENTSFNDVKPFKESSFDNSKKSNPEDASSETINLPKTENISKNAWQTPFSYIMFVAD